MTPTKRQIAKVLRKAARLSPSFPKITGALFEVCKAHGGRASAYYDGAVNALKAYERCSFTALVRLPAPNLRKSMRRAARALEHGLHIER